MPSGTFQRLSSNPAPHPSLLFDGFFVQNSLASCPVHRSASRGYETFRAKPWGLLTAWGLAGVCRDTSEPVRGYPYTARRQRLVQMDRRAPRPERLAVRCLCTLLLLLLLLRSLPPRPGRETALNSAFSLGRYLQAPPDPTTQLPVQTARVIVPDENLPSERFERRQG